MRHILQIIIILLALVSGNHLEAQLTRGSADYADSTKYTIDDVTDSVFIFYQTNTDKYIEAYSPDGDSVVFEWYLYNNASGNYNLVNSVEDITSRITFSDDDIFENPLGYMLVITDGVVSDTFRCWLMLDNFRVEIVNADTLDEGGDITKVVRDANKRCSLTGDIKASIDSSYMFYHNPSDGSLIKYPFEIYLSKDNWYSNPEPGNDTINSFGQNDYSGLNVTVFNPYWKDCYLVLEATDRLGYTSKDSVFYESIIPRANFRYEPIPLNDPNYYPDRSDRYYDIYGDKYNYEAVSAPALFLFKDSSENANQFTWIFGDSLTESVTIDSLTHTYLLPGTYQPRLIAYHYLDFSLETCVDTFPKYFELDEVDPIEVDQAIIQTQEFLPNVFTPPNGNIQYFRFYQDASITDFEIAIYNRYGKRVYHYTGNIRDWDGWDGRIKDSNRVVQTGVYYYVVKEIRGLPDFDTGIVGDLTEEGEDKSKNNIHRGFIHVYNTE